jgi:ubiquinone/menaquinone biosynthesis C-methylase UbiE
MQHYNLQATIYNVQYVGEQNAKIEDALKSMVFGSNEAVLDLGCGTGFLVPYVAQKVGLFVGLDVSRKALLEAKKRTKNRSNTFLVCADADNSPFPDSFFDKVFSITVLQNMPMPTKTIEEMKRTTKPEAVFAVTGLKKKFTKNEFVELLEKAQLKISSLTDVQQLKGYVAVCMK